MRPVSPYCRYMPDWSYNALTVSGDPDQVEEFSNFVAAEDDPEQLINFEKIKPTPAHLLEGDGWSLWRTWNWGTKWNAQCGSTCIFVPGTAHYVFGTAWDPPVPIVALLDAKFPTLDFSLSWTAMGIGSKEHWKDGEHCNSVELSPEDTTVLEGL